VRTVFGWIMFAVLLSFVGTPRVWKRNWTTAKDDPFWKPKPGVPSAIFSVRFVNLSRRIAIPAAVSGPLLAVAYKFHGPVALWSAIAWIGLVIPTGVAIWLFNRPRFLVPPPLRDEPGALVSRLQGRRAA
jgi:hypothetical protein